jgi:hypothetical protein
MTHKDDLIQFLLGDKATANDFARYMPELDAADLQLIYSKLNNMIDHQETDNWYMQRDVRAVDHQISSFRFDFERVRRAMEQVSQQLTLVFCRIFRDPVGAQRNCWGHEQKYGIDKTHKTFKASPATFGDMKGSLLSLIWRGERHTANKTRKDANYNEMRRYYDQGARKLHAIKRYGKNREARTRY